MLAKDDFLIQYELCSDQELYLMHLNIKDYSDEAQEALMHVIQKKGGLDKLIEKHQYQIQIENERNRIKQETARLYVNDTNVDFLKNLITSDLIPTQERQEIIDAKFLELRSAHEDKQVKPRTIFGSLIGGILGSIVGGILWGLQMIQMHRIFFILIAALILISYGFIRFFTKQSKANNVVIVATILSVVGSLFIGQLLFSLFGVE